MDALLQFDLSITAWMNANLRNDLFDWIMPFFTALGDDGFIWILIALVLVCIPKTRKWGILMGTALVLGLLFGELFLKNLIGRARPFTHLTDFQLLIPAPDSYSFPSGHAASSAEGAMSLWFCSRRNGWWAFPLAALIAFSRFYLSVHFLTDILAGLALGVACAFLARWINRRWVFPKLG